MKKFQYNPLPFLLESKEPWVKYNLYKTFKQFNTPVSEIIKIKGDMLKSNLIKQAIGNINTWEETVLKRHNDATHPIHSLELLVEFGVNQNDLGIKEVCEKIFSHQTDDGAFLSNISVPKSFGGTGEANWEWMVCDIPILIYFLRNMGYEDDSRVKKAIKHLTSLIRENGFGCFSSVPKFRGPGRKADHCPYGNLLALKALANISNKEINKVTQIALKAQLDFWDNRKERKIYLFGIGTDFKKIKYPNIYYNILHVLDVLSMYKNVHESKGFKEMLTILNSKQSDDGCFKPESVWRAYKVFDFGQKKLASPTITFKIAEINNRCGLLQKEWFKK